MQSLYSEHIAQLQKRYEAAMIMSAHDAVIIHSGSPKRVYLDDYNYPFKANPNFVTWLPINDSPDSFIVIRPEQKPTLIIQQPVDFWHTQPQLPEGPWLQLFNIISVPTSTAAINELPTEVNAAILTDNDKLVSDLWTQNPKAILNYIHYHRAYKTTWEVSQHRRANILAAEAHLSAKEAFLAGASEIEIHLNYLQTLKATDNELPYSSIVALNENGATLHYDRYNRQREEDPRSFLIDAGAVSNGYIADISRTWAMPGHTEFDSFIKMMHEQQQGIIGDIQVGQSYIDLHEQMHKRIANVLVEFNLIRCSAEEAFDKELTNAFFPHGLGHLIGVQTHDIGGHQFDENGRVVDINDRHHALRLRRPIEKGMIFTIEPGCYIIDQLLSGVDSNLLNKAAIEWLQSYGGARIEDSVYVSETGIENLTRPAI